MLPWTVGRLAFPTAIVVRRFPSGESMLARASSVRRVRGRQECVFFRFGDGTHAFGVASDATAWSWPSGAGAPPRVILFRAVADRWYPAELRRLGDPRRRDALYKADLLMPDAAASDTATPGPGASDSL